MTVKFFGIEKENEPEPTSELLTVEKLNAMRLGEIFATGIVQNSPNGVYMTEINVGDNLRWVAVTGGMNDWAIYIHWAFHSEDFVMRQGDKVISETNIRKLVPCTPDAFRRYRY